VSPERDDYRDEDDREEFASRSIFSAGWFRAVLVLTVLAIVVVISLPYLLNWFEPPPPPATVAKPAEPLKPAPGATAPPAVAPAPVPAPPIAAPPAVKPGAPAAPAPPAPKAAIAPPTPLPQKAVAEKATPPASSEPARKAAPEKAPVEKVPAKAATERPPAKAAAEKAPAKAADKPAAPTRVAAKADAASRPASVASAKPAAEASGSYWIQLGAFKEQKNADTLAKTLRDAGFPIQVTPIPQAGGGESKGAAQQHELFVTDTSVEKVNAALKGRGTAQAVSGGVAVKPAFSLQEAMTVSKRLTDGGLKVVIRPAEGLAIPSQGQGTLHAVRAGGYPNRTKALAARDELAAKGHQGFLAEGPAK
jgi:cell division septation protein DedD